MFGTILTIIFILLTVYVLWRVRLALPAVARRYHKTYIAAGTLPLALYLIGRYFGRSGAGEFAVVLELVGFDCLMAYFLCALCLMLADIITGFGWWLKKYALPLQRAALLTGVVLSLLAVVQGMRAPEIVPYEVVLPGLPQELDGTVVAVMADLHLGELLGAEWLAERVAQVQEMRPDLIVLPGDMFEGHDQPDFTVLAELRGLRAPLGVWAVLGNHDRGNSEALTRLLPQECGIRVLRNSCTEIRPGLVLAGVDDFNAHHRGDDNHDLLTNTLASCPAGLTIFLKHSPRYAEVAAAAGADLTISGHTHGGQIWPLSYMAERLYPLLAGRYDVDGMPVIVSRGVGTWGPRMRLWRPGEISRIILHRTG